MRVKTFLFELVFFAALVVVALGSMPGARVTLTQKGIDYSSKVGVQILQQEFRSIAVPDISGKADSPIGKIKYTLSSITVSSISFGSVNVATVAGSGLRLTDSSATAHVHMNWHYSTWVASDSGSADVQVNGLSLNLEILLSASSGRPVVSTKLDSLDISGLDIKLHGGASWLYSLFVNIFSSSIKSSVLSTLRSELPKNINSQLEQQLATLPIVIPVDSVSEVDNAVLDFVVKSNSFVVDDQAFFRSIKTPSDLPPGAPAVMPSDANTRMLAVHISDYSINTGAYVYHKAGVLHYVIDSLPDKFPLPISLNTSCIFFKSAMPKLYSFCPDCAMRFVVETGSAPTVATNPAAILAVLDGLFSIEVLRPSTGAWETAVDIDVHLNGTFTPILNATAISGAIGVSDSNVTITHSHCGPIDPSMLEHLIDIITENILVPLVNVKLGHGIPLPFIQGVTLVSPELALGDCYFTFDTDINISQIPA